MKKLFGVILAIFMILTGSVKANADEVGATFAYSGGANAKVGENFSVDVVIKDVKGFPITGAMALVDFDREYLEFVSITPNMDGPLVIFTNLNAVKFAGLSVTGDGIVEKETILTITFKAVKEGNTSLGFSELDLCDTKSKTVKGQMEAFNLTITGEVEKLEETTLISNEVIVEEKMLPNNVVENQAKTSEKIKDTKKEVSLDLEEKTIISQTNEEKAPEIQTKVEETNIVSEIINAIIDFFRQLIFVK